MTPEEVRMIPQNSDIPVAWEGQTYSVKRFGATIMDCDSEPIQTPGCIQNHGVLFVLRPSDLTVVQVSENVRDFFDLDVSEVLNSAVGEIVGEAAEAEVRKALTNEALEQNPLYICTLQGRGKVPHLDVTIHTIDRVVIVECERTTAGERGNTPDHYRLLKKSLARLQAAATLDELCSSVCDEVRTLTQLDRVMIYKFHPDNHGEVVAESRRDGLPSWLGWHYPAEDIPLPAREIFQRIWIRPVVDVFAPLAELVPLVNPETGRALTMTYCALRGPSTMYTEYLKNMGVRASLTMPIRREEKLWGLIAGHHYSGPALVPYQIRAACEHLAQVVSLQHKAIADRERFLERFQREGVHRHLVSQAAREGGLHTLTTGHPNLLDAVGATGAALYHRDRWWCVGETPAPAKLDALSEWLMERFAKDPSTHAVYATDALNTSYPPANEFRTLASGLLAVSLSRPGKNMILWFRPETIQTMKWGGNPHENDSSLGPRGSRLTPRRSFEAFVESVSGRSLPWGDVEIESALRLREFILEFVMERAEQLARLNEDLTRSNDELDAFAYVASHDLKEPLRGIHKYAHQLLDPAELSDDERRKKLDGIMQLAVRMDDLLDSLLHFSRVGRAPLQLEDVDLGEVLGEALEIVSARQTDRPTEIVIPRPMPRAYADRARVREVLVNLLSNALKYNDKPLRRVEIGYVLPRERSEALGAPADLGRRVVYYVRDNGIGIQPKHFDQIFKIFRRLHPRNDYGGGAGAGLTITKKVIERHHGRVWLTSVPTVGTTFYFTLAAEADS
jgi:two-component system, chemotaxis family, sensor kinase Cph1